MLVSSLISVLLVPFVTTDGSKGKSDLELITEDFQILARVTNALALQMAAAQKTVTARQLIVEFLKIAPEDFSEITKIDAANAISKLTELKESLSKVSDQVLSSADAQKSFKDSLDKLEKSFETAKNWTVKAETVPKDLDTSLTALTNKDLSDENCSISLLTTVVEVRQFLIEKFDFSTVDDALKTDYKNSLDQFVKDFADFIKCYTSFPDYGKKIKNLTILNTIAEYEEATKTPLEFPALLNNFQKHFDDLKKDLEVTSPAWKKSDDSAGSVSDQIRGVYNAHKMYSSKLDPPLPSFTIAFLEPSDLLKVFDDLKTHWFEQHIVRGASIDNLENSLKPFRQVAEKMIALETTWKPFQLHGGIVPNGKAVEDVVDRLAAIEKFVQDGFSMPVEQYIESLEAILAECVKTPDPKFKDTLAAFEKQETLRTTALNAIKELEHFVNNEMLSFMDFKDTLKYKNCLNMMQKDFPDTKSAYDFMETIEKMKSTFWSCSGSFDLSNFIQYFHAFNKKRISAGGACDKFRTSAQKGPLTLNGVFEQDVNSLNCLRDKKFDIPDIKKMVNFVSSLHNFPNTSIDLTKGYLAQILEVKTALDVVETVVRGYVNRPKRASDSNSLILMPNISRVHSENMAVCTLSLIVLAEVRSRRQELLEVGNNFDDNIRAMMKTGNSNSANDNFLDPKPWIDRLLKDADNINVLSKSLRFQSLSNMSHIFQEVANIHGLSGHREKLWNLAESHRNDPKYANVVKEWDTLAHFDLDFTMFHSRLKDGFVTVKAIEEYFDQVFGRAKAPEKETVIIEKTSHMSWIIILSAVIGIVLLIIIAALVSYGFTKNGKEKYKNLYIFYFGKPEEFEKRWRYAMFRDRLDGKNALLDAIREQNWPNTKLALEKGPYINVHNIFGSTALHIAIKCGPTETVEALIKHGADRSLLDSRNKTPAQWVPSDLSKLSAESAERFTKIAKILKKHKNKKYRIRVPLSFPTSQFHVYCQYQDDPWTIEFSDKFSPIIAEEIDMYTTTHLVVKTDADGILVTDEHNVICWIFTGVIIVKDEWLRDCLKDPKVLEEDHKYLVKKVKYKGVVYDTVCQWSNAMAKAEFPFLQNVIVAIVTKDTTKTFSEVILVIQLHGALQSHEFPQKENYRVGARPYLHANLGPLFLIHDGKQDLTLYKNDPDKMYTLFTEEEFFAFMLKRETHQNKAPNPLRVQLEDE